MNKTWYLTQFTENSKFPRFVLVPNLQSWRKCAIALFFFQANACSWMQLPVIWCVYALLYGVVTCNYSIFVRRGNAIITFRKLYPVVPALPPTQCSTWLLSWWMLDWLCSEFHDFLPEIRRRSVHSAHPYSVLKYVVCCQFSYWVYLIWSVLAFLEVGTL